MLIVSYNHASTIGPCLASVLRVKTASTVVLLLDNGSQDATVALARQQDGVHVIELAENLGFAGAMNVGIGLTHSDYVLCLGPDVVLEDGFFEAILAAMQPGVAMATGLLLDMADPDRIDDAGTVMTFGRQFKSRGAGQLMQGQFGPGDVLAVCGGCCLLSRAAILDLKLDGELFDEDFFAYKEDVDLGWRAHWLGWTCRFAPEARALHARKGGKEASLFMYELSVRNRLFLLAKNEASSAFFLHFFELLLFELYQMLRHRQAYHWRIIFELLPKMLKKRRILIRRRRLSPAQMRQRLRQLSHSRVLLHA